MLKLSYQGLWCLPKERKEMQTDDPKCIECGTAIGPLPRGGYGCVNPQCKHEGQQQGAAAWVPGCWDVAGLTAEQQQALDAREQRRPKCPTCGGLMVRTPISGAIVCADRSCR